MDRWWIARDWNLNELINCEIFANEGDWRCHNVARKRECIYAVRWPSKPQSTDTEHFIQHFFDDYRADIKLLWNCKYFDDFTIMQMPHFWCFFFSFSFSFACFFCFSAKMKHFSNEKKKKKRNTINGRETRTAQNQSHCRHTINQFGNVNMQNECLECVYRSIAHYVCACAALCRASHITHFFQISSRHCV